MEMPWELREYPARGENKTFAKVYPDGRLPILATPEEILVGQAVAALKARVAELEAALADRKGSGKRS